MRNNRRVDGYDFEFVSQDGGNDEFYQWFHYTILQRIW